MVKRETFRPGGAPNKSCNPFTFFGIFVPISQLSGNDFAIAWRKVLTKGNGVLSWVAAILPLSAAF